MPTPSPVMQYQIVIFSDNPSWIEETLQLLDMAGIGPVLTHGDTRTLLKFLERNTADAIVIDWLPSMQHSDIIQQIHKEYPAVQIIVESEASDVEPAVNCIRAGAADYLVKPVTPDRLTSSLERALSTNRTHRVSGAHNHNPGDATLKHPEAFDGIISASRIMRSICQYTEVISRSTDPVLITGETGVGKELFAMAIHRLSKVKGQFVTVNVAGLDDAMFSDTLFGHRKNAFTGADQFRDGLVSKAAQGTLFLDEIGDLNELSQVKLLRLLQEGEYYPVGADHFKTCTARIVLATNVNLKERINKGSFRRDLFYRLCTHQIHLPPLRERKEDIPALCDIFVNEAARIFSKKVPAVSNELIRDLSGHDFPGNIRELQALVRDAVARNQNDILTREDFPGVCREFPPVPVETAPAPPGTATSIYSLFGHLPTFREIEDFLIVEALKLSEGNYAAAASILGVARQTVSKRIKSINSES